MKRLVVYALAILLGVALGCVPTTPAMAASVVINPDTPIVTVRADENGLPVADIMVCASFDQSVSFIEALVSFTDNVRGYAQDGPAGGRTKHWCGLYTGVGPLPPGAVVHMTVDWSANNGNGLSEGHATNGTSFTVPGQPPTPKKTPEQIADLGHASNAMWIAGAIIFIGGAVITVATGGAAAIVLGLISGGACAWLAAHISDLAIDPPDADYQVTVVPHNPDLAALTSSLTLDGAAATAFSALRAHWEAEAGLAEAMVAALYKSEGAAAAGDSQWESTQTLAAAGFAKQLAVDLDAEPALRAAMATAIGSVGGPITQDAIDKQKVAWSTEKLTARQLELVSLGEPKSSAPGELQMFATNMDSSALTQPNALAAFGSTSAVPGTVNAAEAAAAAALRDWADTITAHPVGPVTGDTPSPTPSVTSPQPEGPTFTPVMIPADSVLKDGGFETTPITDHSFITLEPTDAAKLGPGWVIDSGSVDLIGALWGSPAAEGTQFIDLNGNGKVGPAHVHIDVPTRAGHTYRVSFYLAANTLEDPTKTLTASFGDGHKDFITSSTGHSDTDLGWGPQQFTGTAACKSSTRLSFTSTTEGSRGPLLDAITVTDLGDTGGCGGGGVPLWLIIGIVLVLVVVAAAVTMLIVRRKRAVPSAP